jgi:hypothetical protein
MHWSDSMLRILDEQDLTLITLSEHLKGAGFNEFALKPHSIAMHTEAGIAYHLVFDNDRKFISFRSYIPLNENFTDKLEYVNDLNSEIFLCSFFIDRDEDLVGCYDFSYEGGLSLDHLAGVLYKLSLTLDYVVLQDEANQIFDFNKGRNIESDALPIH